MSTRQVSEEGILDSFRVFERYERSPLPDRATLDLNAGNFQHARRCPSACPRVSITGRWRWQCLAARILSHFYHYSRASPVLFYFASRDTTVDVYGRTASKIFPLLKILLCVCVCVCACTYASSCSVRSPRSFRGACPFSFLPFPSRAGKG